MGRSLVTHEFHSLYSKYAYHFAGSVLILLLASFVDYIRESLFDESWRAVWARLLDYFDANVVEEVLDTINSLICHSKYRTPFLNSFSNK